MKPQLKPFYELPTMELIEKLESIIGFNLPLEYKTFLLEVNGGDCEPEFFNTLDGEVELIAFSGIYQSTERDYNNLFFHHQIISSFLPEWLLPIATDSYGCTACICLHSFDYGGIYFHNSEEGIYENYDSERADTTSITKELENNGVIKLANTFNELINSATYSEEASELELLLRKKKYTEAFDYIKNAPDIFVLDENGFNFLDLALLYGPDSMIENLKERGLECT